MTMCWSDGGARCRCRSSECPTISIRPYGGYELRDERRPEKYHPVLRAVGDYRDRLADLGWRLVAAEACGTAAERTQHHDTRSSRRAAGASHTITRRARRQAAHARGG